MILHPDSLSRSARTASWLGLALLLLLPLLLLSSGARQAQVSADLLQLLPAQAQDPLSQRAQARMQEAVNGQLWLLLGHPDAAQLAPAATQLSAAWQASGLFREVRWQFQGDLAQLRTALRQQRLARLPANEVQALLDKPSQWLDERSARLFSPLRDDLLPLAEDWFGLANFSLRAPLAAFNLQLFDGSLQRHAEGQHWLLLQARSHSDAWQLESPTQIAALLERSQQQLAAQGFTLLASGGVLHAAAAQQQAQREINLVGGGGLLGIVLLLAVSFRSVRALSALLPVCLGMAAGTLVTLCWFDSVHVLTLVLGCSLLGVAIDYPLHLLAKRWQAERWPAERALTYLLPSLTLGLVTSLAGYLLLASTPMPALQQVAVFSASGLLAAYCSVIALLPRLLRHWPAQPAPAWLARPVHAWLNSRYLAPLAAAASVLLFLFGATQIGFGEGLRSWVNTPPALQQQEQRFAQLSGQQPTSQHFIVSGANLTELLQREQALLATLQPLIDQGTLRSALALSQQYTPEQNQQALQQQLRQLANGPLELPRWQAAGVAPDTLKAALQSLAALPLVSIEAWLASQTGQPFAVLWLGEHDGQLHSVVSLNGLHDTTAMTAFSDLPGVRWVDPLAHVQEQFNRTREHAAWLIALASVCMGLLLMLRCGLRAGLRILSVPLLACAASLGLLGLLGEPLTLFSLFALWLVLAIGVDYAIFIQQQLSLSTACGLWLQAATTLLSFGLLALSQTPVIHSFGLTLSLGLAATLALTPLASASMLRSHHANT